MILQVVGFWDLLWGVHHIDMTWYDPLVPSTYQDLWAELQPTGRRINMAWAVNRHRVTARASRSARSARTRWAIKSNLWRPAWSAGYWVKIGCHKTWLFRMFLVPKFLPKLLTTKTDHMAKLGSQKFKFLLSDPNLWALNSTLKAHLSSW